MKTKTTVTRGQLIELGQRCANAKSKRGAIRILQNFHATLPYNSHHASWYGASGALIDGLKNEPRYKIFTLDGNTKLPFASFSSLAIVDCPGAGDCKEWCYSVVGWRQTGAYCRQLQNTILLRFEPETVAQAFLELPQDIELRLYVDGDFESADRIDFWFRLLSARPDLSAYGYSKSWAQFIEYAHNVGVWPDNYALNISSGSKFDERPDYRAAMEALPITRGYFLSVEIDDSDLPRGFARYESAEYHKRVREALREQYGKKTASCGGLCGSCGNGKHWCGDMNLQGLTIGIGIH